MMTGFGMGFGGLGLILTILFWGALIAGAVWLVMFLVKSNSRNSTGQVQRGVNALEILDERYARGELDRETYESIKKDMQ